MYGGRASALRTARACHKGGSRRARGVGTTWDTKLRWSGSSPSTRTALPGGGRGNSTCLCGERDEHIGRASSTEGTKAARVQAEDFEKESEEAQSHYAKPSRVWGGTWKERSQGYATMVCHKNGFAMRRKNTMKLVRYSFVVDADCSGTKPFQKDEDEVFNEKNHTNYNWWPFLSVSIVSCVICWKSVTSPICLRF